MAGALITRPYLDIHSSTTLSSMSDSLGRWHEINRTDTSQSSTSLASDVRVLSDHVVRETDVEIFDGCGNNFRQLKESVWSFGNSHLQSSRSVCQ
jgi:hypothetical protein